MIKNYIIIAFCFLFFVPTSAQLSDAHFLPPLKQIAANQAIRNEQFYISTPETAPFSVNVFQGTGTTPIATLNNISNTNSVTYVPAINLANRVGNNITLLENATTGIVQSNSGLRFIAPGGQQFYVNYRGRSGAQATSLTSKGRQALGTNFRWAGIPNLANNANLNSTLGIMATEDGTVITISDFDPDCEFRLGNDPDGLTDNVITRTLNAGQTFVLEARVAETEANRQGFIGAKVTATRPIAISNGYLNAGIRRGAGNRDAGIDQPVPENALGREYVFIRGNGTNETEFPLIIATANNTQVFVNGAATPLAVLNAGDFLQIPGNNYIPQSPGGNMYVTTSRDVYAYQNLAGSTAIQTIGLNFIAPVNCLLPPVLDNIPTIQDVVGNTFNGGITIVASSTTPNSNILVTQDGNPVALPNDRPISGTSEYKTFNITGLSGDVKVESTGPIAVGFIGVSGNAGIAGYFSGFDTVPVVDLAIAGGGCLPGSPIEEVTGGFDAYQWFENGVSIPGATMPSYLPDPSVGSADYFVRVTRGTCTYDSAVLTAFNCDPDVVVTKTVDPGPYLEGDRVEYTIEVESLGLNEVTNIVLSDILPDGLVFESATPSQGNFTNPEWNLGTLTQGQIESIQITAAVDVLPPSVTSITNTVVKTQDQADSDFSEDSPSATINIINADIQLSKVAIPAADGTYDSVGEEVRYTLVATNTGSTSLTNVTITDANADSISPASVANLASGASTTFTATHEITTADVENGQIVNQATVTGTLSNGNDISDLSDDPDEPADVDDNGDGEPDDPTIVPLVAIPELSLTKTVDDDSLVNEGQELTYTYVVTNTGNTIITDVTVTDVHSGAGTLGVLTLISTDGTDDGADNDVDSLAPGDTATFTATYTVVQTDIDNQTDITNTATATGTPNVGTLVDPTADETVTIATTVNSIILSKVADPAADGAYDSSTEDITYTFTVTNNGNTTLTNISLTDDVVDAGTIAPATIATLLPGATETFAASYAIQPADLNLGSVTNTATVSADTPNDGQITDVSDDPNDLNNVDAEGDGEPDDPTITPLVQNAAITISKEAAAATTPPYDMVGEVITYNLIVTNTGNVVLNNISIRDVNADAGSITPNNIATLAAGDSITATATHTITQDDVNVGNVENSATVQATSDNNVVVRDISDDPLEPADVDSEGDGEPDDPTIVEITQVASIAFAKADTFIDTNNDGLAQVGETINYTFTVENTGNVTISGITISDPNVVVTGNPLTLDSGEIDSTNFTATYTITQADIDAGSFSNQATLTGSDPDNTPLGPILSDDPDSAEVDDATLTLFNTQGAYTVTKTDLPAPDGSYDTIGEVITYTIVVENTGNITLSNFVATDDNADTLTPASIASIAPGATGEFTATHNVTQDDLNAGQVVNSVSVTAEDALNGINITAISDDLDDTQNIDGDGDGFPDDDTITPLAQLPELTLEKTAILNNGADGITQVGETISYTFTVINTGNVAIDNINIDDATVNATDLAIVPASLLPNEQGVVVVEYQVTQADIDAGQISNQATTQGFDPNGDPTEDTSDDPDTAPINDPTITSIDNTDAFTVSKTDVPPADGAYDTIGEEIIYTITVTNTGNTTLSSIFISDDNADTITPETIATLAPNTSVDVTATHVITQVDIDQGSVTNQATVNAENPDGTPVAPVQSDDPAEGGLQDATLTSIDQVSSYAFAKADSFNDENNDGIPQAGETISYVFTVENTGNTTLNGITISDPNVTVLGGPLSLEPGVINNTAFTASYTLLQTDIDNGSFANQATINGNGPNGPIAPINSDDPDTAAEDDATITDLSAAPLLEITKIGSWDDANDDGLSQAGEFVNYVFTITNRGNVTLDNITVTDPLPGLVITGESISLVPLESANFTGTYELLQTDVNAGEVVNQATVTGDAGGVSVSDLSDDPNTTTPEDPTVIPLVRAPDIALFKIGALNDVNGDGIPQAGETVDYTFIVVNTGNVTLNNVVVSDPLITVNGSLASIEPLVQDSTTFTGSYLITQEDLDSGGITNTALVEGEDDLGGIITDISDFSDDPDNPDNIDLNGDGDPDDPTFTTLTSAAAIEITKAGIFNDENNDLLAQVGETISYTFTVTNTGNVSLTNVSVSDDLVNVSGSSISLAPGVTNADNFTATYSITQADIDAGSFTNSATAFGLNPDNESVNDTSDDLSDPTDTDDNGDGEPDDPTVVLLPTASSLEVIKTATINDDVTANGIVDTGETIEYVITVTNTGNVTVSDITISDPLIATPGSITLTPGASDSTTFVATYTITQADIDNGQVTNQATATGRDPNNDPVTDSSDDPNDPTGDDDETITLIAPNSGIELDKIAEFQDENGDGFPQAGETIDYRFEVTNTGNTSLSVATVTDPLVIVMGGPIDILPGVTDTMTFSGTYVLLQEDIDAGSFENQAAVTAQDPNGVTITGTSDDPSTPEVDDPTVLELNPQSSVQITKIFEPAADGAYDTEGELINYTLSITNTGNTTLNSIVITDPNADAGSITPSTIASLAPGVTTTATATHAITVADIDAGEVLNQAIVTAADPFSNTVDDESDDPTDASDVDGDGDGEPDDFTVTPITQDPSISIIKAVDPAVDGAYDSLGEIITYSITVTNTGNTTLSAVEITDNDADAGSITPATIASLAPGATAAVTASHTITQADLDAGSFSNQANVEATGPNSQVVNDASDDPDNATDNDANGDGEPDDVTITLIDQIPSFTVSKATDPAADGAYDSIDEVINYTITIENTGNTTINNLVITDANADAGSIFPASIATLAPGATTTATAQHTITLADLNTGTVTNTATVGADDSNGNALPPVDSDDPDTPALGDATVTPLVLNPELTITKTGLFNDENNDALGQPGETITYIFVVENSGNQTITNILVEDALPGIVITGGPIDLNPTEFADNVFTATYTLTQADINAGQVSNQATATGQDPNGADILDDSDDPATAAPDDATIISIATEPSISLLKEGTFNDENGDLIAQAGETITYTFTVENTGNVDLTTITLNDPLIAVPATTISLSPGDIDNTTFTTVLTLTQAQIDAGAINNQADVTGEDPMGNNVVDDSDDPNDATNADVNGDGEPDDATITTLPAAPALSLIKEATFEDENSDGIPQAGETITYDFTITNTGNQTLTNIFVSDPGTTISGAPVTLAPSAIDATTFTGVYTILQSDIDAGSYSNQATASGLDPANNPVSDLSDDPVNNTDNDVNGDGDPDDATIVALVQDGSFAFAKAGTFNDENMNLTAQVGETISYVFTVENTGNITLSNISIADALVSVSGGPIVLAPGAIDNTTFTATYTLTQADLDAGQFENTATVSGEQPDGTAVNQTSNDPVTPAPDDATIRTLPQDNEFTVTKLAQPAADGDYDTVGENIVYDIVITNTGSTTLENFVVTDAGADTITPSTIASIAPGVVVTVIATHAITLADLNNASFTNQATVNANSTLGTALAPVDSDDPSDATNDDPDGDGIPNDPTITLFTINPELALDKTAVINNGVDNITQAGETITYTFTVTNVGNVTISDPTIDDATIGATGVVILPATLNPGEIGTATLDYVVQQADIDAGSISNQATVTAPDPIDPVNNPPVIDQSDDPATAANDDPTVTTIDNTDAFTVSKVDLPAADGAYDMLGEIVTYTITVTNTGNTTLSSFVITDNNADTITPSTIASIAPGASVNVTATRAITQQDIDAGAITNTASVSAQNPNGQPLTPVLSDDPDVGGTNDPTITPIVQNSSFAFTKVDTFNDENSDTIPQSGETISYQFTVENTGNTTISLVSIGDPDATVAGGPITLAPGQISTTTFVGSYTILQSDIDAGSFSNQATVSGTAPDGPVSQISDDPDTPAADDPTVTTLVGAPSLDFFKVGTFIDGNNDGDADTGETITYAFEVVNTGNVTITDINITDPLQGITISGGPITLAPGASDDSTFTATYTLLLADVNNGEVFNQATAAGLDPMSNTVDTLSDDPSTVTDDDPTVVTLTRTPRISLQKTDTFNDENGDGIPQEGETITYSFTVRNTGNVTLTDISVSDPPLIVAGGPITLNPGQVDNATFTSVYAITQNDINTGNVDNTATVSGIDDFMGVQTTISDTSDDPDDNTNIDNNGDGDPDDITITLLRAAPAIDIVKSGVFNDENGDTLAQVGETITYSFVVTNIGNQTLTGISVNDPLVAVTGAPIAVLQPTDFNSDRFSATYAITQADIDAGEVINQATVNGFSPDITTISDDSDDATNPTNSDNNGDGNPDDETVIPLNTLSQIQVVKTAMINDDVIANGVVDAGETITYTIAITNSGNVTVRNITVNDPLIPTPGSITLVPNATDNTTFVVDYIVTQTDIDAGSITNQATASGLDPDNNPVTDQSDDPADGNSNDDPTVTPIAPNSEITLTKEATFNDTNRDGFPQEGETISYVFTVSNVGNTTLTNITIADANPLVIVSGGPIDLAPGTIDTTTFTGVYTIQQADIDNGSFSNTATASATAPDGIITDGSDDPTTVADNDPTITTLLPDSSISITKVADAAADGAYDTLSELITYTMVVTNTGNTTLSNVVVTDMNADAGSITPASVVSIAPGDTATFTAAHSITQADLNNGIVINTATAIGSDPAGDIITDDSDDPTDNTNIDDNGDGEPDDDTIVTLVQDPMISITKEALPAADGAFDTVGERVDYRILVTNSGNITLTNINITDPNADAGSISLSTIASIAPNVTETITAFHTLTQEDLDAGTFSNQATVSALDSNNNTVSDDSDDPNNIADIDNNGDGEPDDVTIITIDQRPEFTITKASNPATDGAYDTVGEQITYTIIVENTGNVILRDLAITDANADAGSITPATIPALAAGESITVTATHTIILADLNAAAVTNTATVNANGPDGMALPPVDSDDPDTAAPDDATVTPLVALPSLTITKTGIFNDTNRDGLGQPGETITYSFTVTNDGNQTITGITVTDPLPGIAVNGGSIDLDPTETDATTFTAQYTLTQDDVNAGMVMNQATVTGSDPLLNDVTDQSDDPDTVEPDDATVIAIATQPEIQLLKEATFNDLNADGIAQPGETITYIFTIENTGNVDLTGVQVTDPLIALPFAIIDLNVGDIDDTTYNTTISLTQANIDAGSITNTASVTSNDPDGNEVTDDSDDPNNTADVDSNGDGEPDDETVTMLPVDNGFAFAKAATFNDLNNDGIPQQGETISYSFEVTNTGNQTLSNIVIDDPIVAVTGGPITLAPGQTDTATFRALYVLTQDDIDNGEFVNQATVNGTTPGGIMVSELSDDPNNPDDVDADNDGDADDATVFTLDQEASITITKAQVPATDGIYDTLGEIINYSIVVTNTGNTTLTSVAIIDDNADAGSITPATLATLAPGATFTASAAHTITQNDLDAGVVENQAEVAATDPNNDPVDALSDDPNNVSDVDNDNDGNPDDVTLTPLDQTASLDITKATVAAADGAYDTVGEVINYTIEVTNTGNTTLSNITLTDPNADRITPAFIASILPGNVALATATHIITQADVDAGVVENIAFAEAEDPQGNTIEPVASDDPDTAAVDDPTVTPIDQITSFDVTKALELPIDGSYDTVGEEINYTIVVTNTGTTTLSIIQVTDANADAGSITPSTIQSLNAGASITATAVHTITQDDLDNGTVENTATVAANGPDGIALPLVESDDPDTPAQDDPTIALLDAAGSIDITKAAAAPSDGAYDTVGEIILYTIVVTNTGNVTLSNIVLTDNNADSISPASINTLDPGEMLTATALHTITQADIDAGTVTNTAVVNANNPQGDSITPANSDDPTTPAVDDPTVVAVQQISSLDITKATIEAADGSYDTVGELINYTIVVTNTGTTTLLNPTVTDVNAIITSGLPIAMLAPGASATITATHEITAADLAAGSVLNVANATASDPQGRPVGPVASDDPNTVAENDPTVTPLDEVLSLEVLKEVTSTGPYTTVGQPLTYLITVTNTSNVALTGVTIGDANADSVTPSTFVRINAGQTVTAVAVHNITQTDLDAGIVINTANVSGVSPQGRRLNEASDDPVDTTDNDPNNDGNPDDPTIVELNQLPSIAITKAADAAVDGAYDTLGEIITYSIVVTNTGNTTLTDVLITDPGADLGSITPNSISTLAPAASFTAVASHTITQADIDNGSFSNIATVSAVDTNDMNVTDESDDPNNDADVDNNGDVDPDDPTVTTLVQNPSISLSKTDDPAADGNYDTLGEIITYTIVVTNTGNTTLTNVVVTDANATITSGLPIATLGAGESVTLMAEHAITQLELDAMMVVNTAIVNADAPGGVTVIDESDDPENDADVDSDGDGEPDDPTVTLLMPPAQLSISKAALFPTYSFVGEVVDYEIIITNRGQTTLSNITVTDPNATITDGLPVPDLLPGESISVFAEHIVTAEEIVAGQIDNQVTVTAENPSDAITTSLSDDPNNADNIDSDGDGFSDDITTVFTDSDSDGIPDLVDLDDDNDGVTDVEEQNGQGDLDTDGDGIIDRLDLDADGDGILDIYEAGHGELDADGDGQLDGDVGSDGIPDEVQNDPNGGDVNYAPLDSDGDGIDDFQDTDDDGDGVPTEDENPDPNGDGNPVDGQDTDGDGIPDYLDQDDDGDGIDTIFEDYENGNGDGDPTNDDTDGDGIPDYLDDDDDNDGLPTSSENPDPNGDGNPDDAVDENNNGVADYLEITNGDPDADDGLEIFDIITPNGDGSNDVFVIRGIQQFPSNTLQIFNRWGVEVYETIGYGQNGNFFTGISNGRVTVNQDRLLPVGTYYYVLKYTNQNGELKQKAGPLYINR